MIKQSKLVNLNTIYNILDYMIVAVLLIGFLFFSSQNVFYNVLLKASQKGCFLAVLWIYIIITVGLFIILRKLYMQKNAKKVCIYIFFVAFTLRVIPCLFDVYIPTNDFKKYFEYGINMYYGRYDNIAKVIAMYAMPKMGGIAVFNGIIAKLFSPTLFGFKIANCIMNSLMCIVIICILKEKNLKVASIAGFLYAIYPSNIVSTMIPANHHGATFFAYFAILFLIYAIKNKENKKGYLYIVICSILLTSSNFIHPSAIIFILAITFYIVLIQANEFRINKKTVRQLWMYVGIIFLCFISLTKIGVDAFYNKGIINTKQEVSVLFKVVVGLNQETNGKLGKGTTIQQDIANLNEYEQKVICLQKIKEEITNPQDMMMLFGRKTYYMWFDRDSWFGWAFDENIKQYEKLKENKQLESRDNKQYELIKNLKAIAANVDIIFIHIIYLFVIIALIYRKKGDYEDIINIMVFVLLGWIALFMFTEVQSRYRYSAMPAFIMIASIGMGIIKEQIINNKHFKRKK